MNQMKPKVIDETMLIPKYCKDREWATYPLCELVSRVVITNDAPSDMVKALADSIAGAEMTQKRN